HDAVLGRRRVGYVAHHQRLANSLHDGGSHRDLLGFVARHTSARRRRQSLGGASWIPEGWSSISDSAATPAASRRARVGGTSLAPLRGMSLPPWRRSLLLRLLIGRPRRRPPRPVGTCSACGVTFAASRQRQADVAHILVVHQTICP